MSSGATCNNFGFTLIELLIVVSVIGILAAIAIPRFDAYRARSYNTAVYGDLRNFRTFMEVYFHDANRYPVF